MAVELFRCPRTPTECVITTTMRAVVSALVVCTSLYRFYTYSSSIYYYYYYYLLFECPSGFRVVIIVYLLFVMTQTHSQGPPKKDVWDESGGSAQSSTPFLLFCSSYRRVNHYSSDIDVPKARFCSRIVHSGFGVCKKITPKACNK